MEIPPRGWGLVSLSSEGPRPGWGVDFVYTIHSSGNSKLSSYYGQTLLQANSLQNSPSWWRLCSSGGRDHRWESRVNCAASRVRGTCSGGHGAARRGQGTFPGELYVSMRPAQTVLAEGTAAERDWEEGGQ